MKKLLTIILAVTMMLALTACTRGGDGTKTGTTTAPSQSQSAKATTEVLATTTEAEEETTAQEVSDTSPVVVNTTEATTDAPTEPVPTKYEQMAIDFVETIMNEDFETAYEMQKMDKTFLSVEDFKWYLPRTALAEYVGAPQEVKSFTTADRSEEHKTITLEYALETITIDLALTADNEWCVLCDDWYYTNWEVAIPNKIEATVNGLSLNGYEDRKEGRDIIYVIPTIPKKDVTVCFEDTALGMMEGSVSPAGDDDTPDQVASVIGYVKDAGQKDALYEEMLAFLNEIMEVFNEDPENSDLSIFFDGSASREVVDAFKAALLKGYSDLNYYTAKKHQEWAFTKCEDAEDGPKQNILLCEKDMLCFTVSLTKVFKTTTVVRDTQIWVRYVDGQIKLVEVGNNKIFTLAC